MTDPDFDDDSAARTGRGATPLMAAWAVAALLAAGIVAVLALTPPREPVDTLAASLSLDWPDAGTAPAMTGAILAAPEEETAADAPAPGTLPLGPKPAPDAVPDETEPGKPPKTGPDRGSPPALGTPKSEDPPDGAPARAGTTAPNGTSGGTSGRTSAPETETAALPAPARPPVVEPAPREPALPEIAPDATLPWQVYAKPFDDGDRRPRIAIVISDLGLSEAATEAAIQTLPAGVSLAFSPYATNLARWIPLARAAGHEVLLAMPMEPMDYPSNDPGPHTLLTTTSDARNLERLAWVLGRARGYVGIVNHMGSRFTISEKHLRPVMAALKERGLLFLDSRSSGRSVAARIARDAGVPRAVNDRFIDTRASRAAIDDRLGEIERLAKSSGVGVGIGFPYPVTVERVRAWAATLEKKGLVLAPVSAVVNRQAVR